MDIQNRVCDLLSQVSHAKKQKTEEQKVSDSIWNCHMLKILSREINNIHIRNKFESNQIFPDRVLIMALADVLYHTGCYYEELKTKINTILTSPTKIPFCSRGYDLQLKYWIIRRYINISEMEEYSIFKKSDVLTSRQFYDFLIRFNKEEFHNETKIDIFTGPKYNFAPICFDKIYPNEFPFNSKLKVPNDFGVNDIILFVFRK